MIEISTPISTEEIRKLKCGDSISLSGVLYTARDAAHKLMIENIKGGKDFLVLHLVNICNLIFTKFI